MFGSGLVSTVRGGLPALALAIVATGMAQVASAQVGGQEPAGPPPEVETVVRTAAEIDAIHSRLLGELMSPYCQGLTLADCPSSGAAAMRDDLRTWLREGRTESWIVDTLVGEWGESILAAPRFRGLGVVAWLAPFAALALAAAGLIAWLRRQVRRAGTESTAVRPATAPALPGALLDRVEAEVDRLLS